MVLLLVLFFPGEMKMSNLWDYFLHYRFLNEEQSKAEPETTATDQTWTLNDETVLFMRRFHAQLHWIIHRLCDLVLDLRSLFIPLWISHVLLPRQSRRWSLQVYK